MLQQKLTPAPVPAAGGTELSSAESPTSTLQTAAEDFYSGRLDRAESSYQALVAQNPHSPEGWFLLGLVALKRSDQSKAIDAIERAVSLRSAHAPYRVTLGSLYRAAGRLEDAHQALERAVLLEPGSTKALLDLATVDLALGRAPAAKVRLRQASKLLPSHIAKSLRAKLFLALAPLTGLFRSWAARGLTLGGAVALQKGKVYEASDQRQRAMGQHEKALALAPNAVQPRLALANMVRDTNPHQSGRHLEIALDHDPCNAQVLIAYALAISKQGRRDEALDLLHRVAKAGNKSFALYCALGWTHYRNGQAGEGLEAFERARRRHHRGAEAHYGAARCLESLGRLEEAAQHHWTALRLNPHYGLPFRSLAESSQLHVDDPGFEQLVAALDHPASSQAQRAAMNFAVAKVYRNAKNPDEAFRYYQRANALRDVTYSKTGWAQYLESVREAFDAKFFANAPQWGSDSELPVFVVGMPRSGTSLVEQIIASHPAAFGAGERDDIYHVANKLPAALDAQRPYPQCIADCDAQTIEAFANEYLASLRALAPDASRVVDKMPRNYLFLGLIACLFPKARILHCRRDPMDTCLSIYFQSFYGDHPYAYDLSNIGHHYRQYERLMEHWRANLPLKIFDVQYEDVVADQRGMTEKILRFCGLDYDERCLRPHETERSVSTASYAQVREPIYGTAIGRWKAYEQYLDPLKAALKGSERR